MDVQHPTNGNTANRQSVGDASANASPDRLATVVEAAEILGITPDAVRSRLRRGTLNRATERGPDGEVLVMLPTHKTTDQSNDHSTDQSETVGDQPSDKSETVYDQSLTDRDASATVALAEHMASEIDHLRGQLAAEREANRENRRLLAAALERIPALEASDTPENAGETRPSTDTPASDAVQPRRSWWKRFFGVE
jgi:hypothetical protein